MKIKVKDLSYEEAMKRSIRYQSKKHVKPKKPNMFFRKLMNAMSKSELKAVNFKYEKINMDKLRRDEACLILMNHSSFIDLKIASELLYPLPYNIVCTSDGFVGKEWLMRNLGCVPTQKFVMDRTLVNDIIYCLKTLKCSVLMYPEASYSFDGTATTLPKSLGKMIKLLNIPIVMIKTYGAFLHDPLYNNLQKRKVDVSATMEYILSPQDIKNCSVDEINEIVNKQFSFDHFKWQQDNNIIVDEEFRADYLNRVLYKCTNCYREDGMLGKGTEITCRHCGLTYELTKEGILVLKKYPEDEEKNKKVWKESMHIPDWYEWERQCVKQEISDGKYGLNIDVDIYMLVDMEAIYRVGEGTLIHNNEGFKLTGCNGKLNYVQKPLASYSLYSDYYWYELGDMICIGDKKILYYCFPKSKYDVVAKTRLAVECLYK